MLLLGIDVGTTGAKAAVFNEEGVQKGYAFREYGILCPQKSYAEQDAEQVWNITKDVIREAVTGIGAKITALSLSVQGDAIIPINKNREALAFTQLGMDYRGTDETTECEALFGGRTLFELTGMRPHPMNSLIKILWVKKNLPKLYEDTYKFVTYADFILGKLGSDEIVIDYTMASRTMAFDIKKLQWSQEILNKLGVDSGKLATPVPSGTVVGTISKELADELELNPKILLVAGGHDQTCAALGAGIVKDNMALDSHGTAEVISTAFSSLQLNDTMFRSYYPCYIHTISDMFFTFSLNHTGGILLKWYVENFCSEDIIAAAKSGDQVYQYIIERMPKGPSPVMVLPHLNGSGTPTCDLNAKGAILGLTMATSRYDIAKAVLEALSYEIRINIENMKTTGIDIKQLRCVGGGARSPVGLQNKADILGIPVSSLKTREAACLGAAMLAGAASGAYKDLKESALIVELDQTYYPSKIINDIYNNKYCIYSQLYDKLKNIHYEI
jgi:xylulokinase